MRGVLEAMKTAVIVLAMASVLIVSGCSGKSDVDGTIKPGSGVALNPGGKPQNAQEAAYAAGQQKTGNAMNAAMQRAAQDMAAARARAGGK